MKTYTCRAAIAVAPLVFFTLVDTSIPLQAATIVNSGEIQTYNDISSLPNGDYEIRGGITTLQDDGSASGLLLRANGGAIQFLDFASAGAGTIAVGGGMGDGGRPGQLLFRGNSTAAAAGITNHPGVLGPNFKNVSPNPTDGFPGETRFYDDATAGTAHFNNEAESDTGASNGGSGGYTAFAGNSSADHATFVTFGAAISNGRGGRVDFTENSTADHGSFRNLNSISSWQYSQGRTVFFDTSNAGHGIFTNVGGDGGFLEAGGTTEFRGTASAGNGTFINQGPTGGSFPQRGNTQFFDDATAASGTFINKAGASDGGGVEFYGHSTAANGNFLNDGQSPVPGLDAGEVTFKESSVAGYAYFRTAGAAGGYVTFHNQTSADHGTFLIEPNLNNARIVFDGSSTADHASFEIGGGGYLQFNDSATGANATILLHGNGSGSSLGSFGSGGAGNAVITVMGAELDGAVGASLAFAQSGTAGNATITVNGASVTTFGASGGVARFDYGADGGTATLIVNGGSNGGAGGRIEFARGATAPHAKLIVNGGGTVDVSGDASFGGTPAGSIEGAGVIYLGTGLLTVGFLDSSTTFSGVISDGSNPKGGYFANGQVTKEGSGALTLSGTNTYTGVTTINAGALAVNGSLAGGVQVNAGATLKGAGQIAGPVTVAPGGIVSPGNSPGTLTILGDYLQQPGSILAIEVAGPNPENRDLLLIRGNADLSGTLLLICSGYAPSANENFPVIQVTGTVNAHDLKIVTLGVKPGLQAAYQLSAGQLILTTTGTAQLRNLDDPLQALTPSYAPKSGFTLPVFTVTGATYRFDTSTDLKAWTPLTQFAGANNLAEFRHTPPPGETHRFYRVIQLTP